MVTSDQKKPKAPPISICLDFRSPRFLTVEYRGLAFLLPIFRPTHRMRRVGVENAADHLT